MTFKRQLDSKIIETLMSSKLFTEKLLPDIQKGDVFPALRNNEIHFYHSGSRLFKYGTKGYSTNLKFASVIDGDKNGDICEDQLKNFKLVDNFHSGYESIKRLSSEYSGEEAKNVSALHAYSCVARTDDKENVISLFDSEVSFESLDEDRKQDRIDICLLNKESKKIRFYEAKMFSNKEIWSKDRPAVFEQIERYKEQIQVNSENILKQYQDYVSIFKKLFGVSIPAPVEIDPKVVLLVLGFDKDQRDGRLENLKNQCKDHGVNYYFTKEIKKQKNSDSIWNNLNN